MPFIIKHAPISDRGNPANEDFARTGPGTAWVLDGASGLWPQRLLPTGPTDAAAFVQLVDEELQRHLPGWDMPLDHLLRAVIAAVRERVTAIAPVADWPPTQLPVAALALARTRQSQLELAVLADCRVLLQDDAGLWLDLTDGRVTALDDAVTRAVQASMAGGLSLAEARARVAPQLQANRQRQNTPGGYWAMGFDPAAAGEAKILTLQTPARHLRLLLMTDGFSRLLDFGLFTPAGLLEHVATHGLAGALQRLRAAEVADPEARQYPRVKPQDDATALYLEWAPGAE